MMVVQKPKEGHLSTEPVWTPVMGAQVLFAPIDRAMVRRARRAAREALGTSDGGGELSIEALVDELGSNFSVALITEGARDWKDVGSQRFDEDGEPVLIDGKPVFDPLPFTPENLSIALADPFTFEAFDEAYVMPFVTRERERAEPGNGSAASPSGTGEAGTQASGTVSSAAAPEAGTDATSAPTSPKSRARKKKTASGAS
jgi:hypothetical protein